MTDYPGVSDTNGKDKMASNRLQGFVCLTLASLASGAGAACTLAQGVTGAIVGCKLLFCDSLANNRALRPRTLTKQLVYSRSVLRSSLFANVVFSK